MFKHVGDILCIEAGDEGEGGANVLHECASARKSRRVDTIRYLDVCLSVCLSVPERRATPRNVERKCADTTGTVPVKPCAGHFHRYHINTFSDKVYTEAILSNTALGNCYDSKLAER